MSALAATVADPQVGLFGPGSVTWRIARESSIFLGSAPAIMLQLAHPWVAAAIVDHSPVLSDPVGRFHRTFGIYHVMEFGTLDQALAAARPALPPPCHGPRHHARDGRTLCGGLALPGERADALRWVHATLVDTGLRVYERVQGRLPSLSATATGPRAAGSPPCSAFRPRTCRPTGTVSPRTSPRCTARRCSPSAPSLRDHRGPVPPRPTLGPHARLVRLRHRQPAAGSPARGLRPAPGGPRQRAAAARVFAAARATIPFLPDRLRYVGPYRKPSPASGAPSGRTSASGSPTGSGSAGRRCRGRVRPSGARSRGRGGREIAAAGEPVAQRPAHRERAAKRPARAPSSCRARPRAPGR